MSFRASRTALVLLAGASLPKHAASAVSSMKRAIEPSGHPFCPRLPSADKYNRIIGPDFGAGGGAFRFRQVGEADRASPCLRVD